MSSRKCPKCGWWMIPSVDRKVFECPYCGKIVKFDAPRPRTERKQFPFKM